MINFGHYENLTFTVGVYLEECLRQVISTISIWPRGYKTSLCSGETVLSFKSA